MKTITGIDFKDARGSHIRNYSLIGEDGKAVAIADFHDDKMVRFACTPALENEGTFIWKWLAEVSDKAKEI